MKIAVTADFHGHLPPNGVVPPCDLLILAGDVLPHQLAGLDEFAGWLRRQPAEVIVGVAGNHDFIAEDHPDEVRGLPWLYLQDEAAPVTVAGEQVKVWGSPRSTRFNDWAFMGDETDLEKVWATIPDDTEILVTHGPAYGLLDSTMTAKSVGSVALRDRIRELRHLRLVAFGHIHESYGITGIMTVRADETVEQVVVINGAYVNHRYLPGNMPITYTLDSVAKAT